MKNQRNTVILGEDDFRMLKQFAEKISVLTPMGAALIGLCKGETIEWKMPAGMKKFEVIEVTQIPM